MKKRNVLLLVAAILGSAYLIYLVSYMAGRRWIQGIRQQMRARPLQ